VDTLASFLAAVVGLAAVVYALPKLVVLLRTPREAPEGVERRVDAKFIILVVLGGGALGALLLFAKSQNAILSRIVVAALIVLAARRAARKW
jgi:hypothetical protein